MDATTLMDPKFPKTPPRGPRSPKKAPATPSALCHIPNPPRESYSAPRFYFWGWQINRNTFINESLLRREWGPPAFSGGYELHEATEYVRWKTGFQYLELADGLVEDGKSYDDIYESRSGEKAIAIAVAAVNVKYLLQRRPTAVQLRKLIKLFGAEPMWFPDASCCEDFKWYSFPDPSSEDIREARAQLRADKGARTR